MSSNQPLNTDLAEEIEAINAIYDPDTITISSPSSSTTPSTSATNGTTIKLQLPNHAHLSFLIAFDDNYPDTPPKILGTASTAARGEGKIAVDVLEDILSRTYQPGAVCLFELINEAVEAFEELRIGTDEAGTGANGSSNSNANGNGINTAGEPSLDEIDEISANTASLTLHESLGLAEPPPWILSEVISEKKSVFVGRAAHVTSIDQAKAYLDYLLASDKKVASATHNISAWRIRQMQMQARKDGAGSNGGNGGKGSGSSTNTTTTTSAPTEMIIQDFDDDGETAAGGRLLHLMQLMDVWDVVVVVTRWYGGIHLGPDRFRIINAAGRDALVKGGFGKEREKEAESGKVKKKGKK